MKTLAELDKINQNVSNVSHLFEYNEQVTGPTVTLAYKMCLYYT